MATYHLYKDGKIINIIEANDIFVNSLKSTGEIDEAIDTSTIENPVSLEFDKNRGHFVTLAERISVLPQQENTNQIKVEDMAEQIEGLINKLTELEQQVQVQANDTQGAIYAIKGFMMLLPDMQKSLLEINAMLQKEST